MIRALETLGASAWFAANCRPSVGTTVQQNIDFPAAVARDDDRTDAELRGKKVVVFGNLSLMGHVGPGPAKHPNHFLVEYGRIGVQRAMNRVPADEPPKVLVGLRLVRRTPLGLRTDSWVPLFPFSPKCFFSASTCSQQSTCLK